MGIRQMTPKEKAREIGLAFYKALQEIDTHQNTSDIAKEMAKEAITIISDGSDYWGEVFIEIHNWPLFIEDFDKE